MFDMGPILRHGRAGIRGNASGGNEAFRRDASAPKAHFAPMTESNLRAITATLWPRISFARRGGWLYLCWQRHRQRRALEDLSDHQLRDIGLTREQVRIEILRPPWR